MQLLMRRPEINRFISISPQPNVYDFSFLAPCPSSGMIVYGENDELVPKENVDGLKKRLDSQKGIKVAFVEVNGANHFFKAKEKILKTKLHEYIQKESSLYQ